MKRIFLLILGLLALCQQSYAYDFSAVAPSGQTLYYNISGSNVSVVPPTGSSWSGYTQPTGALTIPSTVTNGGTTYTVTSIGNYAFYGCSGLTSVTIGNSVTSIGVVAFDGCTGLTSVTIPNSVISIGEAAFAECPGLTAITVSSGNTHYDSRSNCNAIIETSTNTLHTGCRNTIIPTSVTGIGVDAFAGCTGLTSLTIPNSVTSIGYQAFLGCSGLTSVTIPNSVTSIGNQAFYGCTGLTSVTIPNSVTSIDFRAFEGCSSLTSVTIPNSVTSIGNRAFYGCTGLKLVMIPNSVTSIGGNAFYGIQWLFYTGTATGSPWGASCVGRDMDSNYIYLDSTRTTLLRYYGSSSTATIPNTVTSIGNYAFSGCSGLTSVTIPNSVTSIGNYAFNGCSSLTSVTIGSSVISIGDYAFQSCSNISSITSMARVAPQLGNSVFSGVPSTIDVHIPCGSQMSYYSRWTYFASFIEASGFTLTATSADATMGQVNVMTAPTCQNPTAVVYAVAANGYHFDSWNDNNTDNPRSLTLTSDTTIVASFTQNAHDTVYIHDTIYIHDTLYIHDTIYINGEGVNDAAPLNARIYQSNGQIVVEGSEGLPVRLYDSVGRLLATRQESNAPLIFNTSSAGAYLIRIGNWPARRVVVMR